MHYIPLSQYRYAWFYSHREMPLSEEQLSKVLPMTEARALTLWQQNISKESDDPLEPAKQDWVGKAATWAEEGEWQSAWDSSAPELPELIRDTLQWEDSTVVYFCYRADHVVETRWSLFKAHWKNFLFLDDGPLLIGKKRKETVQFFQDGSFKVGKRP